MTDIIVIPSLVAVFIFFVFFLLSNVRFRPQNTQGKGIPEPPMHEESRPGQARIVNAQRAEVQRSQDFTIYKFLLEIFPADSQPAFSASVVWEIAPAAMGAIQPGSFIPVTFYRENLRQVFPELWGAAYSQRYQYAYLGIENEVQPQQIIESQQLAPLAPKPKTIYRRRSQTKLFGMPLWEVAFNLKRSRRRVPAAKARGFIAIGDSATGVIAIGTFARGLVSIGIISMGLFSVGTVSLGILSFGLNALGLAAIGCLAGGLFSLGTLSGGYISIGLIALGKYVFSYDYKNPVLMNIYQTLKQAAGLSDDIFNYTVFGLIVVNLAFFAFSFMVKTVVCWFLSPNHNSLESPAKV